MWKDQNVFSYSFSTSFSDLILARNTCSCPRVIISSSFTQFFGLISICYILKEIHFPVNNFFTYLLGLKLVRTILQCLRICITSSFTHLLHTCQVHISIHMILFQQIFHLPLVFYSPLELVPMFVDLHLTASAHILYVVH